MLILGLVFRMECTEEQKDKLFQSFVAKATELGVSVQGGTEQIDWNEKETSLWFDVESENLANPEE